MPSPPSSPPQPRQSTDTFHTASSAPRSRTNKTNGHGHSHGRSLSGTTMATHGHARSSSTASALADKAKYFAHLDSTPSNVNLNTRLDGLRESGVRRLPLTRLHASPELSRIRPLLRSRMPDLEYLAACAAEQYPRAANGKDLALVLRVSAVLRSLSEDGVKEVTSMPWHMAQMFSVVSPPTAYSTIYDYSPTIVDAQRLLGLDMIEPPSPTLGLGLRVEFVSPHQWPTPVPVPADNGDIMASRASVRSFAASRGVLPGLSTTLDGSWFPWLLSHVYASSASPAAGELDALASLRMASRLITRLYAAARRNPEHVPIPPVLSRTYALVAIGSMWTLYAGVLEGDLVVSEIATVNAADPEALMHMLGLVRAIASEAEERRHVIENWLYCLDGSRPSSKSANSSDSMPVTPRTPPRSPISENASSPPPKYESPRAAPQIPQQVFRRVPAPSKGSASDASTPSSPTTTTSGKAMGMALSPPSPSIAVGTQGRSPVKDVSAWRMAVRRPNARGPVHRLSKSVG